MVTTRTEVHGHERADAGASLRTYWPYAVLILALALGLRLYRIGHDSFWIDEVFSVRVASQPPEQILLNYSPSKLDGGGAEQAPLGFVIMHYFLGGEVSEVLARLPAALCGTAEVGVFLLIANSLVHTPVALLAALFLAIGPLHVWYSQEARYYAQWELLATVSYWAFLSAWRSGRPRAWFAYWLATALSLYTFILSFFVMACQLVSAWLLRRSSAQRHFLRNCVAVQILATVAATPVIWMIVHTLGRTTGAVRPKQLAVVPYTFYAYAAGYTSGPTVASLHALPSMSRIFVDYPIVILFSVVFVPLVFLGLRRTLREPRLAAIVLPWCFGPTLFVFLVSVVTNVGYQNRYALASLPAFVLVVALGATSVRTAWLRAAAIAGVIVCCGVSLANYYWNPSYDKEDARQAVARMRNIGFDDAPVVVVGDVWPAVAHYGPQLEMIVILDCAPDAPDLDAKRTFVLDHASTVWLVAGRDWFQRTSGCLERLSQHRVMIAREAVPGIDLWLLQRTTAGDANNAAAVVDRRGVS